MTITNTEALLNGSPLSSYGVTLLSSTAALMTPAEIKPWVSNEKVDDDGVDYIKPDIIHVAERRLNLTFHIKGSSKESFRELYNKFIRLLQQGTVEIYLPDIEYTYILKYEGCTPFDMFDMLSCKLNVKFTEPKPKNYTSNTI